MTIRFPIGVAALALLTALGGAGCASVSDAQTPEEAQAAAARGIDAATRTAASIADEVLKRVNGDKHWPIVITRGVTGGERALAEVVGTQLIGRGATLEATCTEKCIEVSIIELVGLSLSEEQKRQLSAGDILQVASSATPILGQITRVTADHGKKAPATIVMFVTLSKRDGARYIERQQFIARIGGASVATGEPTALAEPDPRVETPKAN